MVAFCFRIWYYPFVVILSASEGSRAISSRSFAGAQDDRNVVHLKDISMGLSNFKGLLAYFMRPRGQRGEQQYPAFIAGSRDGYSFLHTALKHSLFISFLLMAPLAHATDYVSKPEERTNVTRYYKVYWLDMHVGNVITQIEEKNGIYQIQARLNAEGPAKVTKYWDEARASIQAKAEQYLPVSFHNESNLRKKRRKIELHYDESGKLIQEAVNPPDNRAKRPAVKSTLKSDTVDPLTAILVAHKRIRAIMADKGKGEFVIPIYQGRQLAKYHFVVRGQMKDEFNGKLQSAIRVTVYRKPVAGFTQSEYQDMKREEPTVDVYLSDDAHMLPIKFYAEAPIGNAVAVLEKECYAIDQCDRTPHNFTAASYQRIR
jgi:hypothetical protein